MFPRLHVGEVEAGLFVDVPCVYCQSPIHILANEACRADRRNLVTVACSGCGKPNLLTLDPTGRYVTLVVQDLQGLGYPVQS